MSGLETLVTEYLSSLSMTYFIRQCLVILALFVFGAVLTDLLLSKDAPRWTRFVLAYPAGIAAFVITTYVMLVAGIPYNTLSVSLIVIAETVAAVVINRKHEIKSIFMSFCIINLPL